MADDDFLRALDALVSDAMAESAARERSQERVLRDVAASEIDPYWRLLVETNRDRLADPRNADLLFPSQVLEVPPPPPRP